MTSSVLAMHATAIDPHWETLAKINAEYRGKGGLTQKMRKCLTSAAQCAIRMQSKETDYLKAVKLLEGFEKKPHYFTAKDLALNNHAVFQSAHVLFSRQKDA